MTRKWDAILGYGTLTSPADMRLLMGKQKVTPIVGWDKVASQMEALAVFFMVFIGDKSKHPATYDMFLLIEETSGVSPWMQTQAHHQLTFPVALLLLIHQEFNGRFCHALERRQRVWWTDFDIMWRVLTMGNFRTELVALPGGITPPERPPLHRWCPNNRRRRLLQTQPAIPHHPLHSRSKVSNRRQRKICTLPLNCR